MHLEDGALWNKSSRGGQRGTMQAILMRFAAAALLHYCAYSIWRAHTRLARPVVVQFSQCHPRPPRVP